MFSFSCNSTASDFFCRQSRFSSRKSPPCFFSRAKCTTISGYLCTLWLFLWPIFRNVDLYNWCCFETQLLNGQVKFSFDFRPVVSILWKETEMFFDYMKLRSRWSPYWPISPILPELNIEFKRRIFLVIQLDRKQSYPIELWVIHCEWKFYKLRSEIISFQRGSQWNNPDLPLGITAYYIRERFYNRI